MTKKKLDIKRILSAIDNNDRNFFNTLTDDEKKEFSAWLIMRFASSSNKQPEHHLLMVNDLINVRFNDLKNHPELQWLLFSIIGIPGGRDFHPFIKPPNKGKKNRLQEELSKIYPLMKFEDIEMYCEINSEQDLRQQFEDLGYPDKDIDEIFS